MNGRGGGLWTEEGEAGEVERGNGWKDGRVDKRMDLRKAGWVGERTDGHTTIQNQTQTLEIRRRVWQSDLRL